MIKIKLQSSLSVELIYPPEIDYLLIIFFITGSSYFQPLSWNLRIKVALGAAKGLAYLHSPEAKVIYRDFKSSNILIDSVCLKLMFIIDFA